MQVRRPQGLLPSSFRKLPLIHYPILDKFPRLLIPVSK